MRTLIPSTLSITPFSSSLPYIQLHITPNHSLSSLMSLRLYHITFRYRIVSFSIFFTSHMVPLLQNTPTYHIAYIQLHTLIYLKQHTGLLDVSRECVASASRVERTPDGAILTYWVVGPLHSYAQYGWVDNNNNIVKLHHKLTQFVIYSTESRRVMLM